MKNKDKTISLRLSNEEAMYIDFDEMMLAAFEAAKLFGEYQMVYGMHLDGSHVHVHIVMNTSSFVDGHQYSDGLSGFMKVCGMLKKKIPSVSCEALPDQTLYTQRTLCGCRHRRGSGAEFFMMLLKALLVCM